MISRGVFKRTKRLMGPINPDETKDQLAGNTSHPAIV